MAGAISSHGVENGGYRGNDYDVAEAALAAVASSRRSPTGSKRARQPLPREFRNIGRRSLDGRVGRTVKSLPQSANTLFLVEFDRTYDSTSRSVFPR